MSMIDRLLIYIQVTNPKMTKEKLIEELNKSYYVSISLINTCNMSYPQ